MFDNYQYQISLVRGVLHPPLTKEIPSRGRLQNAPDDGILLGNSDMNYD